MYFTHPLSGERTGRGNGPPTLPGEVGEGGGLVGLFASRGKKRLDAAGGRAYNARAMKKRLRKKYRVGEFRELCFEFSFEYKGDVESPECEQFLHAFVSECVEANGLSCEGNLTNDACNVIAKAEDPRTTNEQQRLAVKTWLEGRSDVEVKSFGELTDAWYD